MAITAADIQNVSFSFDRKGYDIDEVDVFLDHMAEEVDALNQQISEMEQEIIRLQFELRGGTNDTSDDAVPPSEEEAVDSAKVTELENKIEDLEKQLAEKAANDSAISQALIVAQRSADDIVSNARVEASNIIKDADEEADRIIGKAESDRLKIAEAIRTLETDRADVRAEYRDMLENFMADAQKKLAEIDGDTRRAAVTAQARNEANAAGYAAPMASAAPVGAPADDPFSKVTTPGPVSTPSASGFIDKDFSGYGAADDGFSFDDID